MAKTVKLSGYTVIRNARDLDYCVVECIQSMLPVCDEVLVCDSESTDGTFEMLTTWAKVERKLRVISRAWPNPKGDPQFFINWLNDTRQQVKHQMCLELDADEILHESSYPEIRASADRQECRSFHRLNFWGDAQHTCPPGVVCSDSVARLGPSDLWQPSDAPCEHEWQAEIVKQAYPGPSLVIGHYGFLRRREAFFAKSKVMHGGYFNTYDPRLAAAEQTGKPWHIDGFEFNDKLIPFTGTHPRVALGWLKERGYSHELHAHAQAQ